MLTGIIFPPDPVEGRLLYLKLEEEIEELKASGAFLCVREGIFGVFKRPPKKWNVCTIYQGGKRDEN